MSHVKKQYRQGDYLFEKVSGLPEKRTLKADRVVGEGEVTGHRHQVVRGRLWDADGELFVESLGDAVVVHEEHGPIELPTGVFKVIRQKEFAGPALLPQFVRD